jgi:uncharacterized protein with FMN-binding domain
MNILPKRGVIGGALTAVALALVLSFRAPDTTGLAAVGQSQQVTGPGTGQGGTTTGQSQQGSGSGSGSGTGQRSTFSGQLIGSTVQTPYGPVQVQVTLQNGQITDVQALQTPGDQRRSQQISQYAAPQLRSEVLQAQNSQVHTISGATYTSEGYVQSLQSALDQVPA